MMPKSMPKTFVLFSHRYDNLTDKQLNWRPVVSRSSIQPLEFFKNWKKAPKDCPLPCNWQAHLPSSQGV